MNEETNNSNEQAHVSDKSWLERNVNLVIYGLVIACVATLLAQLFIPMFDDHHPAHFEGWEDVFGFHGVFGFVAFVVVVFLGRLLRTFVKREEDYYDQ